MTDRPPRAALITAQQILTEARAMITDRDSWTVQHLARTFDDTPVDPTDHRACKFCVHGAIMRVRHNHGLPGYNAPEIKRTYDCLKAASIAQHGNGFTSRVNDFRGHAAILAVLDEAIARSKV